MLAHQHPHAFKIVTVFLSTLLWAGCSDASSTTSGDSSAPPNDISTVSPDLPTLDAADDLSQVEDIPRPSDALTDGSTSVPDSQAIDAVTDLTSDAPAEVSEVTPDIALDMGVDTAVEAPKGDWLLSINGATKQLQVVSTATGEATNLCKLSTSYSYPSLTFSRKNGLYGSRSGTSLDRINPCNCAVLAIGSYVGFSGVNGITADPGDSLFGIAADQDMAIGIDPIVGKATALGPLGENFTTTGATWSQKDQTLYAINGLTDSLYSINIVTGEATKIVDLDYNFGTVGIEVHPTTNIIYACSSNGDLLSVDPTTGHVTVIGPMGQGTSCTNLAAPWLEVACIALP